MSGPDDLSLKGDITPRTVAFKRHGLAAPVPRQDLALLAVDVDREAADRADEMAAAEADGDLACFEEAA